jgi:K+-transporting ATPase KdpF subunit
MLTLGMIVLGLVSSGVGEIMTQLALMLSIAAFAYLVYAMLRPERF